MKTRVTMDSKAEHIVDSENFPSDSMTNLVEVILLADERTVLKTDTGAYILVSKIESFKEI